MFGLFSRAQMLVVSQQSHVPEKGKFRIELNAASERWEFRLFGCPLCLIYRRDAHTLKTKAARDDIWTLIPAVCNIVCEASACQVVYVALSEPK